MPRWRFWERRPHPDDSTPPATPAPEIAPRARGFRPPPPRDGSPVATLGPERAAQLDRLRKRRQAVLFDVEQAELAHQPDNPWQQRVRLIDEALATIEADIAALDALPALPSVPLPPLPITVREVRTDTPARVAFAVGDETFLYEEEIDWAERGHQLAQPVLTRVGGEPARLLPSGTPADRREALLEHLTASLFAFATDLVNRALAGSQLPDATLADLARPCPRCGGWQDWLGVCAECERRAWKRKSLASEAERLFAERERELEEEARWAERLSIARRRLADIDAQIAALERS